MGANFQCWYEGKRKSESILWLLYYVVDVDTFFLSHHISSKHNTIQPHIIIKRLKRENSTTFVNKRVLDNIMQQNKEA